MDSNLDFDNKIKLGKGNFGIVYKVLNKEDNKYYAMKEISEFDESIINEINILSNINNHNVVKYYSSFEHNDKLYILMEYCENGDLRKFIEEFKQNKQNEELLNQKVLLLILLDICNGLKEIHNKNIIHRDLNPENIFISKDYKIKIGDFGISKQLNNYNMYANTQNGKFLYMAPEMLNKNPKYNNKIDIWELGCIIYELCTLKYGFDCDNLFGLFNKIINEKHDKINLEYYSSELQDLLDLLLKKDYKERPDINEVYNILINYKRKYISDNINLKDIIKNEIRMIIEIDNKDVNREIYFLSNDYMVFQGRLKTFNELNEENTELYIDGKKYKFKKCYKFSEGQHNII